MLSFLLANLAAVGNIAKTVVGIGGLIFVHELGHFLVGRWCGVHPEAFSIGFGPVVAKWRGKPYRADRPDQTTEYRLSAVPLGGYVKFLGENPDERGEPDPRTFHAASYPRKVLIMLAGVTMNFIAAFVLFTVVYAAGSEIVPPVVGDVSPGEPAWEHGLKKGDEFVSIDGARVLDFTDMRQETAFAEEVEVVVRSGGVERTMRLPTRDPGEGVRRLGISPPMADGGARIGVEEDGAAAKAGFRADDRVVAVNGAPVADVDEAARMHEAGAKDSVWTVERDGARVDVVLPWATKPHPRIGVELGPESMELVVRAGGPAAAAGFQSGDRPVSVGGAPAASARTFMTLLADPTNAGPAVVARGGREVSVPLPTGEARTAFAASVARAPVAGPIRAWLTPGPSAARAGGLPDGVELIDIDGKKIEAAADVQPLVKAAHEAHRPLVVRWRGPDGGEATTSIVPEDKPDTDMGGLGAMLEKRRLQASPIAAVGLGADRVCRWVARIFATLKSVLSGGVSGSKLSGPVMIARTTYETAKSHWTDLFMFLGMISVNLAVLNVLPLPVLDGGQLAIHTVERIRGRALPERVVEVVQYAGLVLLLSLMVYVIRNDIINLK